MDCIFIVYALNSSAYRFLVHKSEIPDIHVNMISNLEMLCSLKTSFRTNGKQIRLLGKEHTRWLYAPEKEKIKVFAVKFP